MGRRQGGPSGTGGRGAYLDRYMTEEQRNRRPIFIATLRAARLLAGCFVAHREKTTAGILPLCFAHPAKIRSSATTPVSDLVLVSLNLEVGPAARAGRGGAVRKTEEPDEGAAKSNLQPRGGGHAEAHLTSRHRPTTSTRLAQN